MPIVAGHLDDAVTPRLQIANAAPFQKRTYDVILDTVFSGFVWMPEAESKDVGLPLLSTTKV